VIELGLFKFSPHFNSGEEETTNKILPVTPKEEETVEIPFEQPPRALKIRRKSSYKTALVPQDDEPVAPQVVPSSAVNSALNTNEILSEILEDEGDADLEEMEIHSNVLPEKKNLEELQIQKPAPASVTPPKTEAEMFLNALWDREGSAFLVDKESARQKAGVTQFVADMVFDFLVTTKYHHKERQASFPLIQFQSQYSKFLPIFDLTDVQKLVKENLNTSP